MSQWGKSDNAANSVLWAVSQLNKTANSTNQTSLFGNTTVSGFVTNRVDGQFGLDPTEVAASSNAIIQQYTITSGGSGYAANAVVTVLQPNGTSNVQLANSTVTLGKVTAITANVTLGGYTTVPTVTVAAPGSINIVSNTSGFSNTADTLLIATANSRFQVNDRVYYAVPAGNTAIAPLTGNTYYFVSFANTTAIKVSATLGGANIDITDARNLASPETHTITGDTATAAAVLSGRGYTHSGWVLRTVGTGGRAGRVQYETLVATGSIGTDASDDAILPDA